MDTYFVTSSSLDLCKCKLLFLHGIKSPSEPTNIIDCCFLLQSPPRNNCWRVIHVLCCKDYLRLAIEEWFLLCVLRTTWSLLFEKWLLLFFVVSIAWGKLFEGDFFFVLGRKLVYSCSRLIFEASYSAIHSPCWRQINLRSLLIMHFNEGFFEWRKNYETFFVL